MYAIAGFSKMSIMSMFFEIIISVNHYVIISIYSSDKC